MQGKRVGVVRQLNRFLVKSMRGQSINRAHVYWYGFEGDRRYAFVRRNAQSGFPWLTGRILPQLVQYVPRFLVPNDVTNSAVEVRTPNGRYLPIHSNELKQDLESAVGEELDLIQISRGVFDAQQLSIMSLATANALNFLIDEELDTARFRQNILIETVNNVAYEEESWLDKQLIFRSISDTNGARVRLNRRIQRCAMITIDPETAVKNHNILKTVAQQRDNCVGVYASTEQPGFINVGDEIWMLDGN